MVEEFIGSRRKAKRSEEYVEDLEYRLGRFAKAFQTCIADVSQSDVVRFLSGLGLSARSQYNFRKVLRTFFEQVGGANGDEPVGSVSIATSVTAHPRRSPLSFGGEHTPGTGP